MLEITSNVGNWAYKTRNNLCLESASVESMRRCMISCTEIDPQKHPDSSHLLLVLGGCVRGSISAPVCVCLGEITFGNTF